MSHGTGGPRVPGVSHGPGGPGVPVGSDGLGGPDDLGGTLVALLRDDRIAKIVLFFRKIPNAPPQTESIGVGIGG